MSADRLDMAARAGGWNPYFLAYALATGAPDPKAAWARDGNGVSYMAWIQAQWRELQARLGFPDHMRRTHHAEMMALLGDLVVDRLPATASARAA